MSRPKGSTSRSPIERAAAASISPSGAPDGLIEAAAARSIGERDVEPLGRDIIHSVTNPVSRLTGAIHVYGGDFFAINRSEWDPETLCEGRYDSDKAMRLFEEANRTAA